MAREIEPNVCIALATYNGERFLPDFLKSLRRQSYKAVTVIASDDGSSDETVRILNSFDGLAIRTTMNRGPRGFSSNFANALSSCKSPFICLADQDDVWQPEKIETLLNRALEHERRHGSEMPVLVFSDLAVVDASLVRMRDSYLASWDERMEKLTFEDFILGNRVPGCAMLMNRALLDVAMPIPENVAFHDWWFITVAAAFGKVEFVPESLVLYRQHGANTIGDRAAKPSAYRRILDKVRSPVKQFRERAEAYRSSTNSIVLIARNLLMRYGATLPKDCEQALKALLSPNRLRRFLRFRKARAPFGRVATIATLAYLDGSGRQA